MYTIYYTTLSIYIEVYLHFTLRYKIQQVESRKVVANYIKLQRKCVQIRILMIKNKIYYTIEICIYICVYIQEVLYSTIPSSQSQSQFLYK